MLSNANKRLSARSRSKYRNSNLQGLRGSSSDDLRGSFYNAISRGDVNQIKNLIDTKQKEEIIMTIRTSLLTGLNLTFLHQACSMLENSEDEERMEILGIVLEYCDSNEMHKITQDLELKPADLLPLPKTKTYHKLVKYAMKNSNLKLLDFSISWEYRTTTQNKPSQMQYTQWLYDSINIYQNAEITNLMLDKFIDHTADNFENVLHYCMLCALEVSSLDIVKVLEKNGADMSEDGFVMRAALKYSDGSVIKYIKQFNEKTYTEFFWKDSKRLRLSNMFIDKYNFNIVTDSEMQTNSQCMQNMFVFRQETYPVCWLFAVFNVILLSPSVGRMFHDRILSNLPVSANPNIVCPLHGDRSNIDAVIDPILQHLKMRLNSVFDGNRMVIRETVNRDSMEKQETKLKNYAKDIVTYTFADRFYGKKWVHNIVAKIGFAPINVLLPMRDYLAKYYDISRWYIGNYKNLDKSKEYDIIMLHMDTIEADIPSALCTVKGICKRYLNIQQTHYEQPPTISRYNLEGVILWSPRNAHFTAGFKCGNKYYMYDTIHPFFRISNLDWYTECVTYDCSVHIAFYLPSKTSPRSPTSV